MRLRGLFAGCVVFAFAGLLPASAAAEPVPLAQIGSMGSGAGQLVDPSGVAIDGAGRLYVSDFNNARISVFGADGTFIHAFGWDVAEPDGGTAFEICPDQGACRAGDSGGGAGQLTAALGIAFDGVGNLYVADQNNHRISVFNAAAPSFTRAFGWGVDTGAAAFETCTTASTCQSGSSGGGGGQLASPADVALDGAGSLYVADAGNHRISVFDTATPTFTRAFGWDVAAPGGGMFEVCPADGACQPGTFGGGAGQLNFPDGVVLDASGTLYVADQTNERISVFATGTPSFTRAFGWGVDTGAAAFETCTTASTCLPGSFGGGAGQLFDPTGVALDGAGGLYVTGFGSRVDVFAPAGPSFTRAFGRDVADPDGGTTFEVCPAQGACRIADTGTGPGELDLPIGVEVDCRGAAWVADTSNDRLQRFGEPGTALGPCPATSPPITGPSLMPTPSITANPQCAALRAKLKKAKSKRKKRKIRKRLRKLGC